jgi:hypothetical protein
VRPRTLCRSAFSSARLLLLRCFGVEQKYRSIEVKLQSAASDLGYVSASVRCIPISALTGANVLTAPHE